MKVLHLVTEKEMERVEKQLLPVCQRSAPRSRFEHSLVLLSRAEPLVRGKNLEWVEYAKVLNSRIFRRLKEKIAEAQPTIIHIHGAELLPLIVPLNWKRKKIVASLYHERSANWLRKTFDRILEQSLRGVDRVCFPNRSIQKIYSDMGLPIRKSRILYDGVLIPKTTQVEEFKRWKEKNVGDRPYFVVNESSYKILSHIEKWGNPDCRIAVTTKFKGKSKSNRELLVTFPDSLTYEVIKESNGFLTAETEAQSSLFPIEVLHLGAPVVAKPGGIWSELILDRYSGFMPPFQSSAEWASILESLNSDYSAGERVRKGVKALAMQRHSIVRWTTEVESIYNEIL
ncbi:MAG: hypothetical protein KDD25_02605 [Bdellovibrionales bacterium]|nr:hypothetical protein [Bdellovibrionales bacterium]